MSENRINSAINGYINLFFRHFPEYSLQCRMYALLRRHSSTEDFEAFQRFCLTASPSDFKYFAAFFAQRMQFETDNVDDVVIRLTSGIPCYFPDLLYAIKYISYAVNPDTSGEIPF